MEGLSEGRKGKWPVSSLEKTQWPCGLSSQVVDRSFVGSREETGRGSDTVEMEKDWLGVYMKRIWNK